MGYDISVKLKSVEQTNEVLEFLRENKPLHKDN